MRPISLFFSFYFCYCSCIINSINAIRTKVDQTRFERFSEDNAVVLWVMLCCC